MARKTLHDIIFNPARFKNLQYRNRQKQTQKRMTYIPKTKAKHMIDRTLLCINV